MAAVDYFLKIEDIEGETQDHAHPSEIELLSWSWGETQTGTHGHGPGGGAGKVSMQDFSFTMKVNAASPLLFFACANGSHIGKAILTCRKAGGKDPLEFLKMTFTGFHISSFTTGGSAGSDIVPTESISINYDKIEYEYQGQDANGAGTGFKKRTWDLTKNKGD
jgi:type VI secretion system secreted protein Hcp